MKRPAKRRVRATHQVPAEGTDPAATAREKDDGWALADGAHESRAFGVSDPECTEEELRALREIGDA